MYSKKSYFAAKVMSLFDRVEKVLKEYNSLFGSVDQLEFSENIHDAKQDLQVSFMCCMLIVSVETTCMVSFCYPEMIAKTQLFLKVGICQ